MDAGAEASSPSSPSKLGHRLRTTVCGCFGGGGSGGAGPAAERVRWRRRPGGPAAGAFRYDALSYALNFDEGDDGDDDACAAAFRYRNFNARLPSSPAAAAARPPHQRATAIAIAIA